MNIKKRIHARKIALSYLYQHCFFRNLITQRSATIEALFIDNIFQSQTEKFEKAKEEFKRKIEVLKDENFQEHMMDFVGNFFDEWTADDVDFDYLCKVVPAVDTYEKELEGLVDSYATSFKYIDMDIIDQSLFLLGYVERKVLWTPKEVIINELIELAKRYSDDGSPKLLNGVMHKIITAQMESK